MSRPLSGIVPENGAAAAALADEVGNFSPRDEGKGALFQCRQTLTAKALGPVAAGAQKRFPWLCRKEIAKGAAFIEIVAHAAPANVLGTSHADPGTRLDYGIRRGI